MDRLPHRRAVPHTREHGTTALPASPAPGSAVPARPLGHPPAPARHRGWRPPPRGVALPRLGVGSPTRAQPATSAPRSLPRPDRRCGPRGGEPVHWAAARPAEPRAWPRRSVIGLQTTACRRRALQPAPRREACAWRVPPRQARCVRQTAWGRRRLVCGRPAATVPARSGHAVVAAPGPRTPPRARVCCRPRGPDPPRQHTDQQKRHDRRHAPAPRPLRSRASMAVADHRQDALSLLGGVDRRVGDRIARCQEAGYGLLPW